MPDYPLGIVLLGYFASEQRWPSPQELSRWADDLYYEYDECIWATIAPDSVLASGFAGTAEERAFFAVLAWYGTASATEDRVYEAVTQYIELCL